jgi:carboxypeptidase Q
MFTLTLAILAAGGRLQAPAMGDQATIDAIIREGKDHSQVMKKLTELCAKIGPRLTGSPELAKGQQWAMAEFKKMGLKNVHLDEWGETPVGFDRGPLQTAKMVAPYALDMVFTTPCWTNGTTGVVTAEAILCPDSVEGIEAAKESLKGKWVVLPAPEATPRPAGGGFGGGRGAGAGAGGGGLGGGVGAPTGAPGAGGQRPAAPQTDLVNALDKLPIAGIIRGSRNELCVTGGRWTGKTYENHPGVPQLTVRKSDCDQLLSCFSFNQTVKLAIGAENRWYPGPVKQYNVIADLPGMEKPDEMVIVSGHFDSWNGPGSQGTTDNGTGSMTAMEAARILTKVKAKPKRTIRFILWSGEEQGIYGSSGYVKTHASELPKVSAVLVDDGGTNYQGGYVGLATQKDIFEKAFAPVVTAFSDMPQVFRVAERMPRGGGSDHAPFNAVGVPGFFTMETGRNNYTFVHHTQHDNLSQAIPEYLVQSSTNHAVVAYNLACLPGLLPREVPAAP